jgi:transposase
VEPISRIGMHTSKPFFQAHGVNAAEKVVLRKKLRRKGMVAFFEALAPTVIGIEACGTSHHWARILRSFGHEVKLIAAQLAKPYVKRGKNDATDAAALCEAMSRPTMRFVPVKPAEPQAALMLVGLRDRLMRTRPQLSNAIRGYAVESGLAAAKGMAHLDPLLERIQADASRRGSSDDADPRAPAVQIGAAGHGLDRLDAEGSCNCRYDQARRHHPRRGRDLAQRTGGWGHRRHPPGPMRRARAVLNRQSAQAQAAEARRRGAGEQDRPRRLEPHGHQRTLRRQIRVRHSGQRGLEISQTRGAP